MSNLSTDADFEPDLAIAELSSYAFLLAGELAQTLLTEDLGLELPSDALDEAFSEDEEGEPISFADAIVNLLFFLASGDSPDDVELDEDEINDILDELGGLLDAASAQLSGDHAELCLTHITHGFLCTHPFGTGYECDESDEDEAA